ncbi:MAG: ATP-binding response regulator [Phycisphaerales bacterium]
MRPEHQQIAALAEYQTADLNIRVRRLIIGHILTLVFVPLGFTLDYFVYPQHFWSFFSARWICALLQVPTFVILFTPLGRRCVKPLGFIWPMAPAILISWFIWMTQGSVSSYYAGLNLVIIVACFLLPYTFREALLLCAMVIAGYWTACFLHHASPFNLSAFFANTFFMSVTAVIAVTACYFMTIQRLEDFRLRHELKERNAQLAEMDRLKSEFFANVSHELRTPLTLILGPVEDLLERGDSLSAASRQSLQLVKQNALRLLKLINDLLEVVRLETGHLVLDDQPIDLAELVPGLVDAVRNLAQNKGLTLKVERGSGSLVIRGDQTRLEKVFLNLLTNAVKFTEPGGTICARLAGDNGDAHVEIEDTGIGISASELPYIFDRFRQVDGSTTRKYQGLGLGLALARDLVCEHRGTLVARSVPGRGSIFMVSIPLAGDGMKTDTQINSVKAISDPIVRMYDDASRASVSPVDLAPAAVSAVSDDASLVMVIDDEPDMRRFLMSSLSEKYRVMEAADGDTGLAMALENQPDAIVLDWMMPGKNGLDVCSAVRQDARTQDTKIILLTARVDESSKIEALKRGADDFLTKPFSTIEVHTRLANLLRTAELQKTLRQSNRDLEETLRQLRATESRLIQSEKMNALGSLAAGLLHEINNPLNYTLTAVQLLEADAADQTSEMIETVADIKEGMTRIKHIITDLRTFAYPTKANLAEPFDVRDAVTTALRFIAGERGTVEIDVQMDCDTKVVGSQSQITQVLVNLIQNAVKAVRKTQTLRPPMIRISSKVEPTRLFVTVWDNGTGIRSDILPRIFDPFFTTADVGGGMGLGLSICHTIVTNHHGTLNVRSEDGHWTQVTFDLPRANPEI